MSSPKMTRMFGRRAPPGAGAGSGAGRWGCCCANAALAASVEAAASSEPPLRRIRRRSIADCEPFEEFDFRVMTDFSSHGCGASASNLPVARGDALRHAMSAPSPPRATASDERLAGLDCPDRLDPGPIRTGTDRPARAGCRNGQVARPHGKTATPRCKILSVGKILRISPSVLLPGRRVRFLLRTGKGCIDMHGRACCALIFLLLLPAPSRAEGTCVEPESLAHSTVSITRYFDDAERAADPGFIGARGTGWFLSPTTIVTVGHVAAGMNLSTRDWKELEILDGDRSQTAS